MAHELLIGGDGKAAMFYVDEMPWHKLGTALNRPPTAEAAIKHARLDWKVVKTPLFYHESIERNAAVPDCFAVIPTDGWSGLIKGKPGKKTHQQEERPVFGVVSGQYEPLQNKDAFSFFDPIIESGDATYETAGALGKGERIWVLVKLVSPIEIKGDKTIKYLLLSNSHDGQSSVQIKFTPIRVVCNNTLTWALADGRNYAVKHTRTLPERMQQAQELFKRITCEYAAIEKRFRDMAEITMDDTRLATYLAGVYPEPPKPLEKVDLAQWKARAAIVERDRRCCSWLFRNPPAPPVKEVRDTLWAAYNAVTEYADHCVPESRRHFYSPASHLASIWFGNRASLKSRALVKAGEFAKLWAHAQN